MNYNDDNYTDDDTEVDNNSIPYIYIDNEMSVSTDLTVLDSDLDDEFSFEFNTLEHDDQSISYYNNIYDIEEEFINSEKKDGQYIIGISASGFNCNNESIFACGVTTKTFFKFPYKNILNYLFYYSVINVYYPVINIIQIHIDKDDTYISIRKTYWLCLIQRHWKKIMAERRKIQKDRRSLYSLLYNEIKGKYPDGLNSLPRLKGLLSCYSRK